MRRLWILTLIGGIVVSAQGVLWGQGAIEGVVALTGKPLGPPPVTRYTPTSGQVAPSPPQVAVVYLDVPVSPKSPPVKPVVMMQTGYQFSPGVMAVQTGTQIVFPNEDDDYHNVFSYSKSKRFDLGRYRKREMPPALTLDKAGVVRLYCEIHQHMRGVILVLDTPHFATTDAEGRFRLTGLPAGTWPLKAWLDEKVTVVETVTIEAGKTLRVDFPGVRTVSAR